MAEDGNQSAGKVFKKVHAYDMHHHYALPTCLTFYSVLMSGEQPAEDAVKRGFRDTYLGGATRP